MRTRRITRGGAPLVWLGATWTMPVAHVCLPPPCTQVWLPLLPRAGGQGFELVWAEGWTLAQYKGAVWDEAARGVRFAGERQGGAAAVS